MRASKSACRIGGRTISRHMSTSFLSPMDLHVADSFSQRRDSHTYLAASCAFMTFGPCIYRRGSVLLELDFPSIRFFGFMVCSPFRIRRGAFFVSFVFTHRFFLRVSHVQRLVFVHGTRPRSLANGGLPFPIRTYSFCVSARVHVFLPIFLSSFLTCFFVVSFECFEFLFEQFVVQVRVCPFRLGFGRGSQQLSKLHGICSLFFSSSYSRGCVGSFRFQNPPPLRWPHARVVGFRLARVRRWFQWMFQFVSLGPLPRLGFDRMGNGGWESIRSKTKHRGWGWTIHGCESWWVTNPPTHQEERREKRKRRIPRWGCSPPESCHHPIPCGVAPSFLLRIRWTQPSSTMEGEYSSPSSQGRWKRKDVLHGIDGDAPVQTPKPTQQSRNTKPCMQRNPARDLPLPKTSTRVEQVGPHPGTTTMDDFHTCVMPHLFHATRVTCHTCFMPRWLAGLFASTLAGWLVFLAMGNEEAGQS